MNASLKLVMMGFLLCSIMCSVGCSQTSVNSSFSDLCARRVAIIAASNSEGDFSSIHNITECVNIQGEDNLTVLYWLLVKKTKPNKANFKKLLEIGADPTVIHNVTGRSALVLSARHPDPDYLSMILDQGVDPDTLHPEELGPPTALYDAIASRQYRNLEILLKRGADPNFSNGLEAPLHNTIANNWTSACLLIKYGADPEQETKVGGHKFYELAVTKVPFDLESYGSWKAGCEEYLDSQDL